jgi:hypothetical protein
MKEVTKHIIYNAGDIHQYLTGKLSVAEMHAIEKAALTDPLLAEAIEGFHQTASLKDKKEFAHLQKELDQLKKKIANRHTRFNWWKMAAVLVLFIGFLITYRAITREPAKEGQNIATIQPVEKTLQIKDTVVSTDGSKTGNPIASVTQPKINHPTLIAAATPIAGSSKKTTTIADSLIAFKNAVKPTLVLSRSTPIENSFAGTVNDEAGKSIPFATLILDSTYQSWTDKQGSFDMKATRSFMKLEVKADGYYSKTIDVQPGDYKAITLFKILLKKDTTGDSRLRSLVTILYKNGAEPTDGWDKYLQFMVEQLSNSQYDDGKPVKGAMILTFKIDYNSVPTDFYFEESIDDDVNNAVKKLIEGGPNWKTTRGDGIPGSIRMRIIF